MENGSEKDMYLKSFPLPHSAISTIRLYSYIYSTLLQYDIIKIIFEKIIFEKSLLSYLFLLQYSSMYLKEYYIIKIIFEKSSLSYLFFKFIKYCKKTPIRYLMEFFYEILIQFIKFNNAYLVIF